ncbi:cobalt ion binding [Zea mays]|uniref:Cobalt ion binding n=1 Tax=Zea mays TaxID=4577 RepID=A0A1D6I8E2_MAIZE|nr:cobalt ion binding [Zea mays]
MTRPLVEILRDLNKRVPDKIIDPDTNTVNWYHANRMLSFYAPGVEKFVMLSILRMEL